MRQTTTLETSLQREQSRPLREWLAANRNRWFVKEHYDSPVEWQRDYNRFLADLRAFWRKRGIPTTF